MGQVVCSTFLKGFLYYVYRTSPPQTEPQTPEIASSSTAPNANGDDASKKVAGKFKNRIDSWLKDSEEDASQAQRYLDLKKEKKKQIQDGSTAKGKNQIFFSLSKSFIEI